MTYRTRDTGEGLTLRACGIVEAEPVKSLYRDGKSHPDWTFTFKDCSRRRSITAAFYNETYRDPISAIERVCSDGVTDEDVATIVSAFVRMRKEFYILNRRE